MHLIKTHQLTKRFMTGGGTLHAFENIDLTISKGEVLGLAGESGCGKSTLGKTILRLHEPSEGTIEFEGQNLCALSSREMRKIRQKMQMIFQNPYASLNPKMNIENIIGDPLDIHHLKNRSQRRDRIVELLELVKLEPEMLNRYPHQLSGGQRQRIGIARALAVEPMFIVCDEPLSALDATTQESILLLLKHLQKELNLTYLFISHDLSALVTLSHRIAIMYLGHIVEIASSESIRTHALHPYTQALISAIPIPDPVKERNRSRIILKGELPTPFQTYSGCVFSSRCPFAQEKCRTSTPSLKEVKPGHLVACHLK